MTIAGGGQSLLLPPVNRGPFEKNEAVTSSQHSFSIAVIGRR